MSTLLMPLATAFRALERSCLAIGQKIADEPAKDATASARASAALTMAALSDALRMAAADLEDQVAAELRRATQ